MTAYLFPPEVHTDADNLPGQTFTWTQKYVGFDLTGCTAQMTIDGIAVNLPCTVTVTPVGANVYSTITLTPILASTTSAWLPGVYAYRVILTAPDASTSPVAYGQLLELRPRADTVYGTTGPAGPPGPPGVGTVGSNVKYLSDYGANFSSTWAASQVAADAAWTAAQAAMAAGTIRTLVIDAGDVLAHSTTQFKVYPGCSVIGFASTNIHTSANNPVFEIFGDHATIKYLRVTGDWNGTNGSNAKTSQHAVSNGTANYFEDMTLSGIYAQNMSGDAFYFQGADTTLASVWTSRVSECVVDTCQHAGFKVLYGAEYITLTGCHATFCTDAALYVAAGNFTAVGCVFTHSQTAGVQLAPGFNNSHGSCVGCKINHNFTSIVAGAITDGFIFDGCHVLGDNNVAQVALTSSIGVRFSNCHFPGGNFIFDGSTATVFDDSCYFDESGVVMTIIDNANGNVSQTSWGDCRTIANAMVSPSAIRARREIAGFVADADHTLTPQEDTAVRIVVPPGLLTAPRTLTSTRSPAAGVTSVLLVNNSGTDVMYKWLTGTSVTVVHGSRAMIGSDGTNATKVVTGSIVDTTRSWLATVDATANQIIETYLLPNNSAQCVDYIVTAKLLSGTGAAYWKVTVGAERNSGGAAVLNYNPAPTLIGAFGGLSTLTASSISVAVSATTGAIDFRVTGISATSIQTSVVRQSAGSLSAIVSAPFTPSSLSGLYLWTKSDTGVTGSPVSNWADQSGGGRDWTQSGGGKPVFNASDAQYNGLPSLGFTASSFQCMVTTATLTYGAFTLFMAAKLTGGAGFIYNRGAGPDYLYGTTGNTTSINYPGGSSAYNLSSNWAISASPRTITRVFDGTHAGDVLRINAVLQSLTSVSSADPGTTGVSGVAGLMASTAGANPSSGTVAEVILYNRALAGGEITSVENYLRTRYGYY